MENEIKTVAKARMKETLSMTATVIYVTIIRIE